MSKPRSAVIAAPLRSDWSWPPSWRAGRPAGLAIGLIVPLLTLAVWQITALAGWLPPQVLPAPGEIWLVLRDMLASGELRDHTAISVQRVAYGFAAGALGGLALGIAMGLSPRVEAYVRPLFIAFAQIPALGWIPLLMLLVGIDEALKVLVIAKAAFVPLAFNTLTGIRAVPASYREVGQVFDFTRWQMLTRVVLPAAVPPIFTGVRYGMTHAWLALVAVELLASAEGLGYLMVWGRQLFQLDMVIVAMLVVGLIGFVLDRGLERLEHRLLRWRRAGLSTEAQP